MSLELYNKVRVVPEEAKKNIGGGRLKGMTDINPMWRIKVLTEQFGVCGIGWYYEIVEKWVETCMAKDEITANVMINLYIKQDGEWSKPIQGIGGSMLVASERGGLYVNDECYKMALTDAISVACKALGIGADVYWQKDTTKYNDPKKDNFDAEMSKKITASQKQILLQLIEDTDTVLEKILAFYKVKSVDDMTAAMYGDALINLKKKKEGIK